MPSDKKRARRGTLRELRTIILRSFSWSLLLIALYLTFASFVFSFTGAFPTLVAQLSAIGVLSVMATYLYLSGRQESRQVVESLPDVEKELLTMVHSRVRELLEEGS